MKRSRSTVWALLTFIVGISTSIMGHFLQGQISVFVVPIFSAIVALIASEALQES